MYSSDIKIAVSKLNAVYYVKHIFYEVSFYFYKRTDSIFKKYIWC